MRFYGLIDELKPNQPSGIYSFTKLKKKTYTEIFIQELLKNKKSPDIFWLIPGGPLTTSMGYSIYKSLTEAKDFEISVNSFNSSEVTKKIIFTKDSIKGNYEILTSAPDLFYGLFDDFILKENSLKKILESKGGSELIIIEKKSLPENSHYGGKQGRFTTGLYCEHPKNPEKLIPLANFNEILKSLILEESINSFHLLGAKSIIIEDVKKVGGGLKAGNPVKGKAKLDINYEREVLRKKTYAKDVFQPNLCSERLTFLPDYPNIMNVIDGRINGNQTLEEFTETIDLSANIDVSVLNLFDSQVNFNFKRNWSFKVEFYDKNELKIE